MPGSTRFGIWLDGFVHRRLLPPKLYPTWQAAEEKAARSSYAGSLLNEFRVARRQGISQSLARTIAYSAGVNPALASVMGNGFRVTDFGGATGAMGELTIEADPSIVYTVVENPTLVRLMRQQRTNVQFTTEIPDQCDIFYTSGTIQYVSEPYQALEKGFLSARRHAVLVHNNFADFERFTVQRSSLFDNGSGPLPPGFKDRVVLYPLRTIQEARVHALAEKCGFVLDHQREDPEFYYRGGYSKDLIFRRASG